MWGFVASFLLLIPRVELLPYEVNSSPISTCDSDFTVDSSSLTGVTRGIEGAPCTGYVKYTRSGSTKKVCSNYQYLSLRRLSAQRLCYTLGLNFYRDSAFTKGQTRQMMLYNCDVYQEEGVQPVGTDSSAGVFDASSHLFKEGQPGCEQQSSPDFDCFDKCHFNDQKNLLNSADELDCDDDQVYWAIECSDINECLNGVRDDCTSPFESGCTIRKACGPNTECTNHPGSFECNCKVGYVHATDDEKDPYHLHKGCKDENECDHQTPVCGLSGQCINTPGSYSCVCPTRELWDDSSKTCIGPVCGCNFADPHASHPETYGIPGEVVTYTCDTGFRAPDGSSSYTSVCTGGAWVTGDVTCIDIEECADSDSPCDDDAWCQNTYGSYTCTCKRGYKGDGHSCDVVQCPVLTAIPHTIAGTPIPKEPSFGDEVTYVCQPGFRVSAQSLPSSYLTYFGFSSATSFKITCLWDGRWDHYPVPHCLPVVCPDPGVVPHADRKATSFLYSQDVTYECNHGYRASLPTAVANTFTRTCSADGTWTEAGICEEIDECAEDAAVCGGASRFCTNTPGGYTCSCVPWHMTTLHDDRCVDWAGLVDFPNYEPCSIINSLGLCVNGLCDTEGSGTKCRCDSGYEGVACDRLAWNPALIVGFVALSLSILLLFFGICGICYSRRRMVFPAPMMGGKVPVAVGRCFPPPIYGSSPARCIPGQRLSYQMRK